MPTYVPVTQTKYFVTIQMSSNKLIISDLTQTDINALLPYLSHLTAVDWKDLQSPIAVEIAIDEDGVETNGN